MRVGMILAFVVLAANLLVAQTFRGTILGTVSDSSGAVVPGAKVTVRSLDTNTIREAVSDSAGAYVMPSLQPGDYEIRTTAAGFGK